MDYGRLEYESMGHRFSLKLIVPEDMRILKTEGLAELRRRRLMRITNEAVAQGGMLSYSDLSSLLVSSVSTLKRDVVMIESAGLSVLIRGRRRHFTPVGHAMVAGA